MIPKLKVAPVSPSKFCLWPVSWPAPLLADSEEVVAAISRPVVLKHTTAQDEASHFLLANSFALSHGEMMQPGCGSVPAPSQNVKRSGSLYSPSEP